MTVWVGRHRCLVPGKDSLQLPFLTGDGSFPIVSKYGLSILFDTATRQSLHINPTWYKRWSLFASQATKAIIALHTFAMGAWRSHWLVLFGGIWVRSTEWMTNQVDLKG